MGKCYQRLIKIMKTIDYFGTFITFRVNEDIEYKSIIGGTFTLIYLLFAIGYIFTLSLAFIKRKKINFIYSNKIMNNPFINLTEIGFTFAFGIQYSNNSLSVIEDTTSYLDYTIQLIEWIGTENITINSLNYRKCTSNDFPKLEKFYYMNELDDMLCPIYNSSTNFSIDGLYTDYYYKYISIKLFLTEYAINNYDTLKQLLNNTPLDISIFYTDTTIDYENRKNPLPPYLNYNYKGIDLTFFKKTTISISSLQFISDDNIFIKNPKLTTKSMYSSSEDSFRYINDRVKEKEYQIFEYIIDASPKIVYLKRVYEKLPEFAASISGLLGFVCEIMLITANLIERKAIDQELIHKMLKFKGNKSINIDYFIQKFNHKLKKNILYKNEKYYSDNFKITEDYFEIDDNKTNINLNSKRNNSITEGISIINSESIPNKMFGIKEEKSSKKVQFNEENINKIKEKNNHTNTLRNKFKSQSKEMKTIDLEKEVFESLDMKDLNQNEIFPSQTIKNKKEQEDLVKLNIIQIVYAALCSFCSKQWNIKYRLIKSAERKIHYYMDIVTYIKTVQEFELLKEMLFNENYLRLFQFVCKPTMKILNDNFVFCHHFEREYCPFKKIGKVEIDSLYLNYKQVLQQEKSIEKLKILNFIKGEIDFLQ